MEKIEHKMVKANGLNIHVAEIGQGPLVLFLHGFPELWYSWRHQMLYMAAHGYRAVAPDLRGYGDTTGAPIHDPTKFTTIHIAGDLFALLDAIAPDQDKVFVVGHDWGAFIAWHMCLYRPDRIKAVVNLSVPFIGRDPDRTMVDSMRAFYGDDHYMCRFQEAGEIESVFAEIGVRTVLKKFLTFRTPGPFYFPEGKPFGEDHDVPVVLPCWLSEEDVDYYTTKFEQTGFTGPVNYYRSLHANWELTGAWTGAQVKVPAKYIVGELDLVYHMPGVKDYIHKGQFKKEVPFLDEEVVVMEDAAHFINQEKPDDINRHIYHFIQKF